MAVSKHYYIIANASAAFKEDLVLYGVVLTDEFSNERFPAKLACIVSMEDRQFANDFCAFWLLHGMC